MSPEPKIPFELKFPGQREEETVMFLVRKHWIILVKMSFVILILMLVPIAIFISIMAAFWHGELGDLYMIIALVFNSYLLFMCFVIYEKLLNEELDLIIVTNERVIAHNQLDIFHREICETSLDQIQDVRGSEKGMFGSLLNYGHLEIQTASKEVNFSIQYAANPHEGAREIFIARDAYIARNKAKPATYGE